MTGFVSNESGRMHSGSRTVGGRCSKEVGGRFRKTGVSSELDSKEKFGAESKSAANLDETSIVASTESVSGVSSRTDLVEGLKFLIL